MAIQYIRPDADLSIGGWTDWNGQTTDLYQFIDDVSTSGYIIGTAADGIAKFRLSNPDPVGPDTGHVVEVSASKRQTSGSATVLSVYLYQGATLIASDSYNLSGAPRGFTINLSEAEAANITDYDDLRIWFDTSGGPVDQETNIYWARMTLPDANATTDGEVADSTWSISEGVAGFNIYVSGATDPLESTWSIETGTIDVTTPLSTWRDVFTIYNPSTDAFHVGQIDMTHNVTPGDGPASSVDFNHFVYSVGARELYRFKYEDCYGSAFIQREGLSSSEVGGPFYDRPDSVILGFWSWGAWPDLDNENDQLLYEASLPRDLVTTPTTNGYPYYGSSQPSEECFLLIPASEFDDPFSLKTFKRIWLWLIPPPDADDSVTIQVTVYPHPVNAQASVGTSVLRTTSMSGYTPTVEVPQPVKLAYLDFDPQTDPEAGTGSVSGSAFEVKVQLATAIGIWRVGVEVEVGGDIKYMEYQT